MSIKKLLYPIDLTGTKTTNRVEEQHVLGADRYRAFALRNGPFFADSVSIRETATSRQLVRGDDYECTFYYQEVSELTAGLEVTAVIVVHNQDVADDITVAANIVGGPFVSHAAAVAEAISLLEIDNRNTYWANVLLKPNEYQASAHLNDIGDVFGMHFIIDQLAAIRDTMIIGDNKQFQELRESIRALRESLEQRLAEHEDDVDNPHQTTNDQVNANTKEFIRELESRLEQRFGELEPRFTAIDDSLDQLGVKYNQLGQSLQALNLRQGELEATYQQINRLIADINEEIRIIYTEIARIDRELDALRNADAALQAYISNVESVVAELRRDHDALDALVGTVIAKNTQQDATLSAIQNELGTKVPWANVQSWSNSSALAGGAAALKNKIVQINAWGYTRLGYHLQFANKDGSDANASLTVNHDGARQWITFNNYISVPDIYVRSDMSDKRSVTRLEPLEAKSIVKQLKNGWRYSLLEDPRTTAGVSANELEKVFPEAVLKTEDGKLNVTAGAVHGLLISALNQAYSEIETLRGELKVIKAALKIENVEEE